MKDDCRKCAYLPYPKDSAEDYSDNYDDLEDEVSGLELIASLARGRKEKEQLFDELSAKKSKLGRKKKKKGGSKKV